MSRGFKCLDRTITSDFLTALTNPSARIIHPGFEDIVPRTPDEFAQTWETSEERASLIAEIEKYGNHHTIGEASVDRFRQSQRLLKAASLSVPSPLHYLIS